MSLSRDRKSWKTKAGQGLNGVPSPVIGVVRGLLVTICEDGTPMVDFEGNPSGEPIAAVATIAIATGDPGREAVLMFEDGDARRPILIGLVQTPRPSPERCPRAELSLDGEHLVFSAENEIVLRCGQASIILTRAGKILIRGKYVLSRSSGVNRIKGGSVQIN